jgi:hypothetical protein
MATTSHRRGRTLSQIPGSILTAAAEGLPPCSPKAPIQMREVDTQLWGRYSVKFQPMRHAGPKGHEPRWVWIPVAAERLEQT